MFWTPRYINHGYKISLRYIEPHPPIKYRTSVLIYYVPDILPLPPSLTFIAIGEEVQHIMAAIYLTPSYYQFPFEKGFKILWPRFIDPPSLFSIPFRKGFKILLLRYITTPPAYFQFTLEMEFTIMRPSYFEPPHNGNRK